MDSRNTFYPIFVALGGKVCLVIGGGQVAERKVRSLMRHGPSVRVVARELTPWLSEGCSGAEPNMEWLAREYDESLMEGTDIVFAATSDPTLNREIAGDARRRGLWCNMATDPELGSFIVPSVVERGLLSIAISTGGASPAHARIIREELENEFGLEWAVLLDFMAHLRKTIQSRGVNTTEAQRLFREIAGLPLLRWIRDRECENIRRGLCEICGHLVESDELNALLDELWKLFSSSSPLSAMPVGPSAT